MKPVIWGVCAVFVGLWTTGAFVVSELTRWAARLVTTGATHDLGQAAAGWPMPAWLAVWVDPAWFHTFKSTTLWTLDALSDAVPFVEATLGWLVPLVWAVWGVGLVLMLGMAGIAHWLAGRSRRALRGPAGLAHG